jgi:uncharacterized heparinase superfamily protein
VKECVNGIEYKAVIDVLYQVLEVRKAVQCKLRNNPSCVIRAVEPSYPIFAAGRQGNLSIFDGIRVKTRGLGFIP